MIVRLVQDVETMLFLAGFEPDASPRWTPDPARALGFINPDVALLVWRFSDDLKRRTIHTPPYDLLGSPPGVVLQ